MPSIDAHVSNGTWMLRRRYLAWISIQRGDS